jgi:GYF domain 2
MFEAFAILQGDNPFDQGRAVGYLMGGVICVLVVVIMPIVLLVSSRKQKAVRVDLFQIFKNGQQCGPYSVDQIRTYLSSGEFQPTDLAWYQNAWVPLSAIPVIVQTTRRTGPNG